MSEIAIAGDSLVGDISGVGRYIKELIEHGAFEGFESVVFTPEEIDLLQEVPGIEISACPPPEILKWVSRSVSGAWWVNLTLRSGLVSGDFDLFFGPNYLSPVAYDGPSVIVVHDMIHEVAPRYLPSHYVYYMKLLLPRSVQRAEKVLTVSENTRTDLIDLYGVSPDKIEVVYGAADDRYSYSALDESKIERVVTKYGIKPPYVLYVGNIEPRKNIHTIVRSLEETSADTSPQLAIAGQRFHAYPELDEVYERSPGKEDVKFLGYVEEDDLPYLYAGARVFLFPSYYEGFGLPVIESMKGGTPVIGSNRASLPEVIGDGGVCVDPDDPAEMGRQISRFVQTEDYRVWQQKAIDQASTFRWEESASAVNEILTETTTT